jgi:hypothetical protein
MLGINPRATMQFSHVPAKILSRLNGQALFGQPVGKVVPGVHIGNEAIIGILVGAEIGMNIAVIEPFGAHIVEVVGRLQLAPVFYKL